MDETLNTSTGADASTPAPGAEDDASATSREPSSHPCQGPTAEGAFVWSESPVALPEQSLNKSQAAIESTQAPPKLVIDDTPQNTPGFGSHVRPHANDGNLLAGSKQESLATLLGNLYMHRGRGQKRSSMRICGKARRILEEHPNIDVNELVDGQVMLHDACHHGHWELLNLILERPNVDVNIRDNVNYQTPLHVAVIQGRSAFVKRLLDMDGIDVQAEDADGYLPVHYAAENQLRPIASRPEGYIDGILLRLCDNGAAVNARTPQQKAPLHLAAQAGNVAALEFFLAQPDLDISMTDARGETALHLAENINVAAMLLEKGLDANIQNCDGNTALHFALGRRSKELVHLLLKNTELDRVMPNRKGEQFMHMAAARWDLETFEQFAATPSRDINRSSGDGETVLHIAARVNNIDIVEYLLGIPSVVTNAEDHNGQTALHLACEKGHVDIVKSLLSDPSIYVNARDKLRRRPLHLACEKGHLSVVRVLLAHDLIDADAGDANGWTPLHFASRPALGEPIVSELLSATKDIDKQVPVNGATALHFAALAGNFKVVLDLLEHGADPRITCTGLVGPDGFIGKDAAGVADKLEIVDLIRHYRWRRISLVPSPLSYPQEGLLKRHASGVYIMWEWPRTENSSHSNSKSPSHKRERLFPDISPVYKIYVNLASDSQKPCCYEEQWQLRHASCQQKGWSFALDDKENGARVMNTAERQRATKWVHFSAQNRRWIEDFCRLMYSHGSLHTEGIDVLTFIDDTFDQKSVAVGYSGDIYREHCVKASTLPVVTDEESNTEAPTARMKTPRFSSEGAGDESRHYSVAAIVVPLIDIDMMRPGFITDRPSFTHSNDGQLPGVTTSFYENPELTSVEQAHIDMIMSLHSEFKVQRSRSLDHYFHRDLTDADLQIVNAEQVLSRFIHHQQAKRDPCLRNADLSNTVAPSITSRILSALRKFLKILAELGMASTSMDTQVEDGLEDSYIKPHLARQYVIVVPQLWLWKIDNVLITAFPARWDSSNLHSASEYIRSRVEMQKADVKPIKLLHEIVAACLEYQPTFSLFGRQLTYQDAFSGEISRISRDIDRCYKGFRNDLGKSDDRFFEAFKTATTSLLDIDDALNELKMIKRVYQNQAQVWEDLHKDPILAMKCGCKTDQGPRRLYTSMMTRLEEDARSVRESVVTLLQLTQGSASTENALKASEQSKILAIFTVVTVIFTPLSWIAALFAVKIEGFHAEETWTSGQVAGGSIICLGGTLVLCALGWKWLNREQTAGGQTRGVPRHRTYRSYEKGLQ